MKFKIIQINIWGGKLLSNLITFLKKENPDIITMQEVTSGKENLHENKDLEIFTYLKGKLNMNGACAPVFRVIGDPESYQSNAIFVKTDILSQRIVWFKDYYEVGSTEIRDYEKIPRNVLDICVKLKGYTFHVLSTHLVWTQKPVETTTKLQVAEKLAAYLKCLQEEPFVLGGDFNMLPGSKIVRMIDSIATNILKGSNITRTTNPNLHKTKDVYPNGLLVDFIYTSKHFIVNNIDAPIVDISDHLPIVSTLSVDNK